jgi:DNA helicase-2/ATP-dependent DNA helicase PcrA
VLAGAGSGKTRVLTHRIAHLLSAGHARPEEILAVTFTNKAAGEMRERVARLVGGTGAPAWMGTFHSVCARLLRAHIDVLGRGYDRSFAIYDADDQLGVLDAAIEGRRFAVPVRALLARIDQAKNEAASPSALLEAAADPLDQAAAEAWVAYQRALERNNALDFGDLLVLTLELFERAPSILEAIGARFRHVLVDEYQDTNRAQYLLLRALAGFHRNLCAVGDEDQSIYRWRGADIGNILDFEKDYPDAAVIRLEENYRSTQHILAAAGAVIRHNRGRRGKTLWTRNPEGPRPLALHAADERAEARFVTGEIARLARHRPLGDFVVFYRMNAQSRVFEEECLLRGLPYRLVGGVRFYSRREVRDLLAYLRVLVNPADEWSWLRILNVPPRGIGPTTVARLTDAARDRGLPFAGILADPPASLSSEARRRIGDFVAFVAGLRDRVDGPIAALLEDVIERAGYGAWLREREGGDAESRLDNLRELVTVARESDEAGRPLGEFLEQAALIADADEVDGARDRVTLMTLHTSKGLEFPVVFLAGMEEGVFPHRRSLDDPAAIEEERRLCYVGMTRARERLVLSLARRRHLFGAEQVNPPSRFLREIPSELLDVRDESVPAWAAPLERMAERSGGWTIDYGESQLPESEWRARAQRDSARRSRAVPEARRARPANGAARPTYPVGTRVRHATLGEGIVRTVEGSGEGEKVTVTFAGLGVRKLAVRVAPLETV